MFCNRCGSQVPDGQPNCPNCGAGLAGTQGNFPVPPVGQGGIPVPLPESVNRQGTAPTPPQGYAVSPPQQPVSAGSQMPMPAPAVGPAPAGAPVPPAQAAPTAPTVPGQPVPVPVDVAQKKKNRKPLIIGISAALIIVFGIGIFAGVQAFLEGQRSEAYASAVALMDNRRFQAAYDGFVGLGDYKDSVGRAAWCEKGIVYEDAMDMKENKDYEDAIERFSTIGDFEDAADQVGNCKAWIALGEASELTDEGKYQEAADMSGDFANNTEVGFSDEYYTWSNRNDYGLADQKFQTGDYYGAYEAFLALGSYEDAADRAEACKQAFPGNAELYHNEGFSSSAGNLVFDGAASPNPYYIKVYSGETLVSTVFVNAGGSTTISLPLGTYTFKDATGDYWFGEGGMFGDDGYYSTMIFDGSSDVVTLEANMVYTVTLYIPGGEGNIGGRTEDRDSF